MGIDIETCDDGVPIPGFIRSGTRISNDGETRTEWILLDRKQVEEYLKENPVYYNGDRVHHKPDPQYYQDLIRHLCGWEYQYNGPGRWFWDQPGMTIGKNKILITQFGGLDI